MAGLSPFALVPLSMFGWGLATYATGSARLMTYGELSPDFDSIDRDCRCLVVTSGCVVDGTEPFVQPPNNAAVRLLTRVFGPMPGAYRGVYPTREEVRRLAAQAPRRSGTRELGTALREAGLPEEVGRGAFCTKGMAQDLSWAVIDVRGEAIIVAFPEEATLFDKATGRPFARYRL